MNLNNLYKKDLLLKNLFISEFLLSTKIRVNVFGNLFNIVHMTIIMIKKQLNLMILCIFNIQKKRD